MKHTLMKSALAAFALTIGAATSAMAQPASDLSPQRAAQLLEEYVRTWEDDARVNAATVARFYAPRVNYYGKRLSRQQVLADKLRYVRAYPRRSYAIAPGTARFDCAADRSACVVTGRLVVGLTDARGRESRRATRLRLVMSGAGGGQIVEERASR